MRFKAIWSKTVIDLLIYLDLKLFYLGKPKAKFRDINIMQSFIQVEVLRLTLLIQNVIFLSCTWLLWEELSQI